MTRTTSVNGKTGSISGISTATNLVNGFAEGSVRTTGSALESNDYKLGAYSYAEGNQTKARGTYSHAEGNQTNANGYGSHAEGYQTNANGSVSHAEGQETIVYGYASHVEGKNSFCNSTYAGHAEGYATISACVPCAIPIVSYSDTTLTAQNDNTVSYLPSVFAKIKPGMEILIWNDYYSLIPAKKFIVSSVDTTNFTIVLDSKLPSKFRVSWVALPEIKDTTFWYPAHSEGTQSAALGDSSHAEGNRTIASGYYSHAEGRKTKALGTSSHAEGEYTKASGYNSHAEGNYSHALGSYSHSEGYHTMAEDSFSHAEGNITRALGVCSHAAGFSTMANSYQHTMGHYNSTYSGGTPSSTNGSAFLIGNGTTESNRSNCFRIQYNGQVFSQGAYSTSGADYAELFEWEDGNPNNEDRRGHFVALRGNKIHIAQPGENIIGVISSTAAMVGNNHSETWQGMYITNVWGDILTEYKEIPAKYEVIEHPAEVTLDEEGNETVLKEAWEEKIEIEPEFKGQIPVLNPDYDPNKKYTPRHERPEWGIVGLLGQLTVIDNGTCQVDGYCECTEDGTATATEKGYRVIERLDDTHIRILVLNV